MIGPINGHGPGYGGTYSFSAGGAPAMPGGWWQGGRLQGLGGLPIGQFRADAPGVTNLLDPAGSSSIGNGSQVTSVSWTTVRAEITEMLQAIGGTGQQNQMLQLLITLLILSALLQQEPQSNTRSGSALLEMLGQGSLASRPAFASWTTTTYSVESTSASQAEMAPSTSASPGCVSPQPAPANVGSGLDVAA